MTKKPLKKRLKSIGKTIFVENFLVFQEHYANKKNEREKCIEALSKTKAEGGAGRCCSEAKAIFHLGREQEALEIIASSTSTQLPSTVKERAQELIISLRNKEGKASRKTITPRKKGQAGL